MTDETTGKGWATRRRITKWLVVTLLSCFVASTLGILWLSFGDCTLLPQRLYHVHLLGDRDFISKGVRFKVRFAGNGHPPGGPGVNFTTVRASDCVEVTSQVETYGSPAEAASELQKRIHGAIQVMQEGHSADQRGERPGRRVVLLQDDHAEIVLQLGNESKLYVIRSVSLAHAIAYERIIQGGYRFDPHGYVIPQGQ